MKHRWQKHPHLWPLLLWTALWALFFSTLLLGIEHLGQSDLLTQFHTFGRFQTQEMLAGRFPLWSPGSYGGFPFAADTQAAVFYLPRWLTIFLSVPWDFPFYALTLEGLLHIWLLGIFTYFLAYDITQNRWAGLIAAAAFGLGGFITSYPILQLAILETMTWLPLILLLLRRGVRAKRPLPWLIGAALILGLSFLAGHPQTFLHISYLAASYYLFLTIRARWQWRWVFGLGVMVAITAVAFATAAWLPALRYMQASTRNDVTYEFVAKGFALLDYFQLWLPGPFTNWVPMYLGLPALALAIFAWLTHRQIVESETKTELGFWTAATLITFFVSLGDKGVLFELVYHTMPGFSLFRQQERIVSLFSLSLALIAAIGMAQWHLVDKSIRQQAVRRLLWILVGALLLGGFVLVTIKKSDWIMVWLQQAVITAVSLILLWRLKPANWRSLGLILLLCFDLFLLSRQQLNYQTGSPTVYWPQPEWLTTLKNDDPGRINTQGFFSANVGELHGLEDTAGISPLRPQALDQFEDLPVKLRWQLLNVTHVLAKDAFVEGMTAWTVVNESVFPDQQFQAAIYRFENSLPRAWMVYQALPVDTDELAMQLLKQPEFDPASQVILTTPQQDITAVTPPSSPPIITTSRPSPGEYHIQVTTDTSGVLVLSEWAYPGWQASVNGKSRPIETANSALQAVILPAGTHDISIYFAPSDVYMGAFISLVTLIGAILLAWLWKPTVSFRNPSTKANNLKLDFTKPTLLSTLTSSSWVWIAVLIVLLGFSLRVFHLGAQELRGDEAFSYLFARMPAAEITPTLVEEGDPHSPFHYLLLHGWMALTGDSEFAMRFSSLLPGLLLVPLSFQLGRLLGSRKLGLLAAFWVALSHLLIWLSQDLRNQYMLTLFFSMVATIVLIWKLAGSEQNPVEPARWKRTLYWLIYTASAALAVYSHYYGLFILISHGLYLWWPKNGRLRRVGGWLLAGTMAALLFLPWAVTVTRSLLAAGQLSDPSKPELAQYLAEIGIALTSGNDVGGWWPRWLFVAALAIVCLGGMWLLKHKTNWGLLLVSWLAGATLFIYLIRFSRATYNSFYISVAAPAWWLLFSVGLLVLWQQRWRGWRLTAVFIAILVIIANGIGLKNYYFDPAFSRSNGYRSAAATIQENVQPGDVFLAHFPDPVWGYYLRHASLKTIMLPETPSATQAETEQGLHTLTETYDRFWFVPYVPSVWDRENVVGRWLDYHMLHESQSQHQDLTLHAFRPLRTMAQVATPVNHLLNDEIMLESAFITVNGQPVPLDSPLSISANDTLSISLLWSASNVPAGDYTVFVHLFAEDGSMVGQHDGVPLFGTRPTSIWAADEQLLDQHQMQIIKTGYQGNGRLLVGMYHPETLERLPFENGNTALELAPVVINNN